MNSCETHQELEILIEDGCTKDEAKRHLERGSLVVSPEAFVEDFLACPEEDGGYTEDDLFEKFGYHSFSEILKACKNGLFHDECFSSLLYNDTPYVIIYCL